MMVSILRHMMDYKKATSGNATRNYHVHNHTRRYTEGIKNPVREEIERPLESSSNETRTNN